MTKRRAKGEGSIYKRKDSRWRGRYTDCNGKLGNFLITFTYFRSSES